MKAMKYIDKVMMLVASNCHCEREGDRGDGIVTVVLV